MTVFDHQRNTRINMDFAGLRRGLYSDKYFANVVDVLRAAQASGYPDIHAQILDVTPAEAFQRVEKIARDMGWAIVAADAATGRIEATDTTFWYGFKDDIVIRIEAEGEASRVDIRSVSRVGKSDVGKNAARIRAFIKQLGSQPVGS